MTRQEDFDAIKVSLKSNTRFFTNESLIVQGDSLTLLKSLPDQSISLILTDPPYHSTICNRMEKGSQTKWLFILFLLFSNGLQIRSSFFTSIQHPF
jgi:DNA modification methylase